MKNIILKDLKKCFDLYPDLYFANHYGATEASIGSVIHHIRKSDFERFSQNPVVGAPYDNFRIYILDEHFQLLPVGSTGIIYIAGDGVSRGYLNKENITREKFVKNLFNEEVMYKTGDLGAWTPEGTIIFKGRNDNQVKIRGYRIELDEIESVLLSCPDVTEAVVLARNTDLDEKQLVAYLVSDQLQTHLELRTVLKQILPDYMIPAHFIQLERLPLTSNGKVDKSALPAIDGNQVSSGTAYVAPGNELERQMVVIWERILKRKNIGVKDDFFALGGNSLNAVTLINSIAKEFEVKLKIDGVFSDPTIAGTCKELERAEWLKTIANNSTGKKTKTMEI